MVPGAPPIRLNVNIDHVATVRQARRATYPDPVDAARIAEAAGAHGLTVHLRGDRRHIQDHDLERLRAIVRGKLNLEMAASDEMVEIAVRAQPHQVTLVAERDAEITTEGGLQVAVVAGRRLERLRAAGLPVALFIDPEDAQIEAARALLERGWIEAIELNTDAFARAASADERELDRLRLAAGKAARFGFRVYAGHALRLDNVGLVAAIPEIEELNVGHALVGRALLVGMAEAVREFLAAMALGRGADLAAT